MMNFLRPLIELSIILPGMLLAYLPVKTYIRFSAGKLAAAAAGISVLLCLALASVCCLFQIRVICMFLPAALISGIFYVYTLNMSPWKSVSVFLAICAVFSCLGSIAKAIHAVFYPGNADPWLSVEAGLAYVIMCWIFVILFCYPAAHSVRELLEDESFAQTWYVFWVLPLIFTGLNLFMIPVHPEILYQGRLLECYIIIALALLFLLLMFYGMFYLMAASLNRNDHLRQENQFLSMQQTQYDNLRVAIDETRSARHDMRHHFNILSGLAKRGDWESLADYLSEAQKSVPDTELNLCDNPAADSVASHYAILCKKNKIPFSFQLDLPRFLPVPEMDFCLVLSNLLENALEASLKTESAKRQIHLHARLHSSHIILLTVENSFDGVIKEKNGIFQSSKRKGNGIGTQSVRHIAEKSGGYCRFSHKNGIFCANVMLR